MPLALAGRTTLALDGREGRGEGSGFTSRGPLPAINSDYLENSRGHMSGWLSGPLHACT